ncbi:MAG: sensor signal transduction histidine kinase [Pedosphaera sp.]|nr:sensor signal transduction histidine kinase [Pedosphaera sp.]
MNISRIRVMTGRQPLIGSVRQPLLCKVEQFLPFLAALFFGCFPLVAADAPLEELHTAEQVRRLTAEQAAQHYPVRLRGVVMAYDQSLYYRFIQDETAGIYLGDPGNMEPLIPGQLVEIEGTTNPGEYAPIIMPQKVKVLGPGTWPQAKPKSFEQLASGEEDSQFVEIHGIVRATSVDATQHLMIDIATGGGRLTAYSQNLPDETLKDLVDSSIRVRGVCVTLFNQQRQLFQLRLMVPRAEDLVVEKSAPKDPFLGRTQSIATLLQFTPEVAYGHRVKVAGTVVYRQALNALYIEDEKQGLYIETKHDEPLLVGDRVEVLGFPAKGEYTPMLEDAVYRKVASGPLPVPPPINADEALKGIYDCRLVRINATLLDRGRQSHEQFMMLQSTDGYIFRASLEGKEGGTGFAYLRSGTQLAVTGVCLIETGSEWHNGPDWRAKSFRILLRSPGDVFVLKYPPWWTLQKMLWMVGVLLLIVLVALIWVVVLRSRVRAQTEIISQKLQLEATLKERYVNLFENANDIVYAHDLAGKITSINQAGERLLQRPREEILNQNIIELVVKEEQGAARQWLNQVLKGEDPPAAEWDFTAAAGQRVKLEISTRLIKQRGQGVEVEGIARDITERKRLEREILEISNREQRRIGHDLHDGVCQILAGIAFMSESLADVLEEKNVRESSQAERISVLIKTAINQTRSVARGLFPVRLEENGLASALEELAANASEFFRITCQFVSRQPPHGVDNEVALHLYYITLEAVANASKHGKAKKIIINLEPAKDRYRLEVQDDGVGFAVGGSPHAGMGIRIMQYRARVIGATLSLESHPGSGTHVVCLFPPVLQDLAKTNESNGHHGNGQHAS